MRYTIRRMAMAACCLLASVHGLAQDAGAERLRIHGSNTIGMELMPALVESWLASIGYRGIQRQARTGAVIEIQAVRDGQPLIVEIDRSGSAAGFADLVEGRTELAMMTRAPTAAEREEGWQLGDLSSPDQEFVLALDGLAVVVHPDNPVQKISVGQLRAVLGGQVTNWKSLGGPDAPIRLHLGRPGTGSREFLQERVMGGRPVAAAATHHARLRQAAEAVAGERGALAIVGLATRLPVATRALAVSDGGVAVQPTRLGIGSEDYPLLRRYRLYGGTLMSALGRSFALYSISRGGQQSVERAGYLSMTLRPAASTPPQPTSSPYGEAVAGASRLPLGLRFNIASLTTFFESRSARDMERLVAFMKLPENRGRQLVVVGFTNNDPDNRLVPTMVSNERADVVASYLAKEGITVRRSLGLGAERPLVAFDSHESRQRNERVEVWIQ